MGERRVARIPLRRGSYFPSKVEPTLDRGPGSERPSQRPGLRCWPQPVRSARPGGAVLGAQPNLATISTTSARVGARAKVHVELVWLRTRRHARAHDTQAAAPGPAGGTVVSAAVSCRRLSLASLCGGPLASSARLPATSRPRWPPCSLYPGSLERRKRPLVHHTVSDAPHLSRRVLYSSFVMAYNAQIQRLLLAPVSRC